MLYYYLTPQTIVYIIYFLTRRVEIFFSISTIIIIPSTPSTSLTPFLHPVLIPCAAGTDSDPCHFAADSWQQLTRQHYFQTHYQSYWEQMPMPMLD